MHQAKKIKNLKTLLFILDLRWALRIFFMGAADIQERIGEN